MGKKTDLSDDKHTYLPCSPTVTALHDLNVSWHNGIKESPLKTKGTFDDVIVHSMARATEQKKDCQDHDKLHDHMMIKTDMQRNRVPVFVRRGSDFRLF